MKKELKDIKKIQLELLNKQLSHAKNSLFYKNKLPNNLTDFSQIQNIPFTTKNDLINNFQHGFIAIKDEDVIKYLCSSGTTGIPTLYAYSKKDIENLSLREADFLKAIGINKNSTIQNMMNYGLYTAAWTLHHGAYEIGAKIIPTSSGNTLRQLQCLDWFNVDYTFSCPSYLQHILSLTTKDDIKKFKWKNAIVGGEPISQSFKKIAKDKYDIEVFNFYGMTEAGGHIAAECPEHSGLHVAENYFYLEIVDPKTNKNVPDGEYGEIVLTSLQADAMPLIRYKTNDISRIITEPCKCGRTSKLIEPIQSRIDNMININGVNIFPSQIEDCIFKILSHSTNYQIHINENLSGLKKISIKIELPNDIYKNNEIVKNIQQKLSVLLKSYITISPILEFVEQNTLGEAQNKRKIL